jgi:hypothetical protein
MEIVVQENVYIKEQGSAEKSTIESCAAIR